MARQLHGLIGKAVGRRPLVVAAVVAGLLLVVHLSTVVDTVVLVGATAMSAMLLFRRAREHSRSGVARGTCSRRAS